MDGRSRCAGRPAHHLADVAMHIRKLGQCITRIFLYVLEKWTNARKISCRFFGFLWLALSFSLPAGSASSQENTIDIFRSSCLDPIVTGADIGKHPDLELRADYSDQSYRVGREWFVPGGLFLTELFSEEGHRACQISAVNYEDSREGAVVPIAPIQRRDIYTDFEKLSSRLFGIEEFIPRTVGALEDQRMLAIETVVPNERGFIVVAFAAHHFPTNDVSLVAAEAEGTGT